jgi:hypothetical protein
MMFLKKIKVDFIFLICKILILCIFIFHVNLFECHALTINLSKNDSEVIKIRVPSEYSDLREAIKGKCNNNIIIIIDGKVIIENELIISQCVSEIIFENNSYIVNLDRIVFCDNYINATHNQNIFRGTGRISGTVANKYLYSEWFGAKGDGFSNDKDAFLKAKDIAEYKVIELLDKIYVVDNLVIDKSISFYGKSNSVIKQLKPTGLDSIFTFDNVENIVIKNIIFDGDYKGREYDGPPEWSHNIQILGGKNIEIKNCKFKNAFGDNIYIGPKSIDSQADNIFINDCFFESSYRSSISLTSGKNIFIVGNTISKSMTGYRGVNLEPNPYNSTWYPLFIDNINIIYNNFSLKKTKAIELALVNEEDVVSNINIVSNNISTRESSIFIAQFGLKKLRVQGNVINGLGGSQDTYRGVAIEPSKSALDGLIFRDNMIFNCSLFGKNRLVTLSNIRNAEIAKNIIISETLNNGAIIAGNMSNCIFADNYVDYRSCSKNIEGFLIYGEPKRVSQGLIIKGNIIRYPIGRGISFSEFCSDVSIIDNLFIYNELEISDVKAPDNIYYKNNFYFLFEDS